VGTILNDVFFFYPVLSGKLAYYFTEQYAVEATYLLSSLSTREVVKDLDKRHVETNGLVGPKNYYGLDFKWTPVYGKMGFMNKSVVPFDHYFTVGGGITNTNQATSPATIHLGTGQIYALSKWMAFRWDLGFYFYSSATKAVNDDGTAIPPGNYMNMHLTIGASFFFPEAKYR